MNQLEFVERINKIESFYEKELNEVQLEAWMNSLMNINIAQFDYLIKQIFIEFSYMPKLAQVIELKNKVLYELKMDNQKQIQKEYCKNCKSTGLIKYTRTENGIKYDYFARCTCKNGLNYMNFPLITKILECEKNKCQKIVTEQKTTPQNNIQKYLNQIGININEK